MRVLLEHGPMYFEEPKFSEFIAFWAWDVLRVGTSRFFLALNLNLSNILFLVILVFKVLMRRTRTKTLKKCRQRKHAFKNWKQRLFLFVKHLNKEGKLVIETWPRLTNKIISWILASFSTKPEMNDTSYCYFACIHPLNLSGIILENI